jgi:type II secretory pathway predicted ATPase ExeA
VSNHRSFFGFKREPFAEDLEPSQLLKLPGMISAKERLDYALALGGVMALSGEVGSGKSTSIRWALSQYHASEVKIVKCVGNGGPITEFYKTLCWEMGIDLQTNSRSKLIRAFQEAVIDAVKNKRQKVMVVVDEAGLLRADVFTEMHVLTQFEQDSKHYFALVLAGQRNVIDKVCYRASAPLASRVIARSHLSAITRDQMEEYLNHHVKIAGNKNRLFQDDAITAIQQGSGGLLRKANGLARGALIASAAEKLELVTAEHVRIASSELIE